MGAALEQQLSWRGGPTAGLGRRAWRLPPFRAARGVANAGARGRRTRRPQVGGSWTRRPPNAHPAPPTSSVRTTTRLPRRAPNRPAAPATACAVMNCCCPMRLGRAIRPSTSDRRNPQPAGAPWCVSSSAARSARSMRATGDAGAPPPAGAPAASGVAPAPTMRGSMRASRALRCIWSGTPQRASRRGATRAGAPLLAATRATRARERSAGCVRRRADRANTSGWIRMYTKIFLDCETQNHTRQSSTDRSVILIDLADPAWMCSRMSP